MGLENLDAWHLVVVVLVGLFIFGPDRLPKAVSDGVRMLRQLRRMASDATGQLSRELGTDISLEDLHPKTLVRKHLLSEEDEAALRAPLRQLADDLQTTAKAIDPATRPHVAPATPATTGPPHAGNRTTMYPDAT
jgi:sec-independent protein translocase protein TatB